ncbi:hypothetical protein BDW_12390 [Bdellovibrio bacteriovorus W]|nr:hypothetical protein BDW_12390 [Bdellovibrio bacteriovorus W]
MRIEYSIGDEIHILENAEAGRTLLDLSLIAKIPWPYSCMEGTCGTCTGVLLEGETTEVPDSERRIRLCQALPKSDLVRVSSSD